VVKQVRGSKIWSRVLRSLIEICKLLAGRGRIVVMLLGVHARAQRPYGIPQYGHQRNRHDPQVEPCALDRKLDERREED
jgi:hypothetical protein